MNQIRTVCLVEAASGGAGKGVREQWRRSEGCLAHLRDVARCVQTNKRDHHSREQVKPAILWVSTNERLDEDTCQESRVSIGEVSKREPALT